MKRKPKALEKNGLLTRGFSRGGRSTPGIGKQRGFRVEKDQYGPRSSSEYNSLPLPHPKQWAPNLLPHIQDNRWGSEKERWALLLPFLITNLLCTCPSTIRNAGPARKSEMTPRPLLQKPWFLSSVNLATPHRIKDTHYSVSVPKKCTLYLRYMASILGGFDRIL